MRILFDSKDKKYKSVFGCLKQNEECIFRIDIPSSCQTVQTEIIFERENGNPFSAFSLNLSEQKDGYDIYSGKISFSEKGLYFYYFRIKTKFEEFSLYKYGYDMTNIEDGDKWQLSVIPKDKYISDFYAGKVMYQIFPDRFNKCGECDVSEKLRPFTVHENLADTPDFLPDENGKITNSDFFGGNLRGIKEKLPYLKELGVSLIYLNPIFKAYSNHRYDTCDYKKIDEMLGNEKDFSELCAEAHKNNIRIIIDGVFSHTGSNSIYFDKNHIFGTGAYSDRESPFGKWYDFQEYPDKYTSWWGIDTLPCVNETEESYIDYIIDGENSVVAYWLSKGCDGFRLDVADELPDAFIEKLYKRVKELNKECLVIGEVWEDASNKISYGQRRSYFTENELDSVMNYPYKNVIASFVNRIDDGTDFKNTVMTIAENYPADSLNCLMNFLSTHDTSRIITALGKYGKTDTKTDRANAVMSRYEYEKASEKLLCAVFLQFVLPGMACIYYGDEIGTEGFEDPFCRRYMNWDKTENSPILEFYKEIAGWKNTLIPLQKGDVSVELPASGVVLISRVTPEKKITAVCNVSDDPYCFDSENRIVFGRNFDSLSGKTTVNKNGFVLTLTSEM